MRGRSKKVKGGREEGREKEVKDKKEGRNTRVWTEERWKGREVKKE